MKTRTITKISVMILVLVTLISVFAVSAFAADVSASMSSNRTSAQHGQEISVSIKLNNAQGLRSIGIDFNFDPNVFEVLNKNINNDGWKVSKGQMPNYDVEKNKAGVAFLSAENVNGEIFVLTLRVKENATLGNQSISAKVKTTSSTENEYEAGTVTIKVECKHTGGGATCTNEGTCTFCGERYLLDHSYNRSNVEDKYLKSPANCTDKAVYFKSCSCGEKGTSTFTYGSTADHIFTENVDDAYLKSTATCTAKAVYAKSCPGCGLEGTDTFEAGEMLPHSYGAEWLKDANGHWQVCSCGATSTSEAHIWDAGLVTKGATESEEGVKTFTCMKCYETKEESIDKLVPQPPIQPETESDSTVWIVICIIEAVIIVALVIILVLVVTKKTASSVPATEKIDEAGDPDQLDKVEEQKNSDDINTSEE